MKHRASQLQPQLNNQHTHYDTNHTAQTILQGLYLARKKLIIYFIPSRRMKKRSMKALVDETNWWLVIANMSTAAPTGGLNQEFESSLSYLKRVNTQGVSLYDHLVSLVLALQSNFNQPELLQQLERLSVTIKQHATTPDIKKEIPSSVSLSSEQAQLNKLILAQASLLSTTQNKTAAEKLPQFHKPTPNLPKAPRLQEIRSLRNFIYDNAAISVLSPEEAYKLQYKLADLARNEQLDNIRFWGKVLGTERDYYVVEVKINRSRIPISWSNFSKPASAQGGSRPSSAASALAQQNPKLERLGTGLNEFVYYVCNHLDSNWVRLPLAEPDLIIKARAVTKFLSGRLNAPVIGLPVFPYSEAYLLRAQIARISANTHIAPRGFFTVETVEEEEENSSNYEVINVDHEWGGITGADELLAAEQWVHEKKHILKQGRNEPFVAPESEEEEEKLNSAAAEEEEEALPSLQSIDNDEEALEQAGYKLQSVWNFRNSNPSNPSHPHAAVIAKSLLWPGAVSVAKGKEVVSVYYGYANKYLPTNFTPAAPAPVATEFITQFNPDEEEVAENVLVEQSDPLPPLDVAKEEGAEDEEGEDEDEDELGDEDLGSEDEEDQ
jgi:radial spoke head protein 4A